MVDRINWWNEYQEKSVYSIIILHTYISYSIVHNIVHKMYSLRFYFPYFYAHNCVLVDTVLDILMRKCLNDVGRYNWCNVSIYSIKGNKSVCCSMFVSSSFFIFLNQRKCWKGAWDLVKLLNVVCIAHLLYETRLLIHPIALLISLCNRAYCFKV